MLLFRLKTVYNNNNKFRRILLLPPSHPTAIFAHRRRKKAFFLSRRSRQQSARSRLTATEFMAVADRIGLRLESINQFANPSPRDRRAQQALCTCVACRIQLLAQAASLPCQMFSHFTGRCCWAPLSCACFLRFSFLIPPERINHNK